MIIVCEPQCKGISHEKVNSGFIYGLRLAYPNEKIILFADFSHFDALKNIFHIAKVKLRNIELIPIRFNADKSFSLEGIIMYLFLFNYIFGRTKKYKVNKIFFLSNNPIILLTVKILKKFERFKDLCFTFVLHGELEDIANGTYKQPYVSSPPTRPLKLWGNLHKIPVFVMERITRPFTNIYSGYSLFFKKRIRMKQMLLWNHSDQYKFVALSPHVVVNAEKFIDTSYLDFHTIIMPIIFNKTRKAKFNKTIKFAVFGYGDPARMHEMLTLLSRKKISKPYEIKIISMDRRGTEGFENISYVGNGGVILRNEMENAAKDVDIFINLYKNNHHSLGCSLSIFEAFYFLTPVLYTTNPGYDYFNNNKKPIGFKVDNLEEFVEKLSHIVNDPQKYRSRLVKFRKNMLDYRKVYDIRNNLDILRESFTFHRK